MSIWAAECPLSSATTRSIAAVFSSRFRVTTKTSVSSTPYALASWVKASTLTPWAPRSNREIVSSDNPALSAARAWLRPARLRSSLSRAPRSFRVNDVIRVVSMRGQRTRPGRDAWIWTRRNSGDGRKLYQTNWKGLGMLSGFRMRTSGAVALAVAIAIASWATTASAATPDELYAAAMARGDRWRAQDDLKHAMQSYQEAERNKPTAEIALRIGDLYSRRPKWLGEAAQAYEAGIKRDPRYPGPRLGLARLAIGAVPVDTAKVLQLLSEEEGLQPGRSEVAELRQRVQHLVEASEARRRARDEASAREAESERRDQETRAKIQSQVARVGPLECKPIVYEELGESIGSDVATTTASGVYVAALVKCINVGKKTVRASASDFTLIDRSGRRYAVDSKGSYYQSITARADDEGEERQRTPDLLQLHPGVTTSIVAVFDVPPSVAQAPDIKLDIRGAKLQLTFAEGEAQQTSTKQGKP